MQKPNSIGDWIGKITKEGATASSQAGLLKTIEIAGIIIILFIFLILVGLPWYIGVIFIAIAIGMVGLGFLKVKRIESIKLQNQVKQTQPIQNYQGEKIINSIAGIMRTGVGSGSTSVLGVGEVSHPENAMVITNKRILLIFVPIAGADKIIDGADINVWQWLLAKKDIENKLRNMLNSMAIVDILRSDRRNFSIDYNNIERVKFGNISKSIEIITKDGKKFKYSIRDKKDFEKAKTLFQNFTV